MRRDFNLMMGPSPRHKWLAAKVVVNGRLVAEETEHTGNEEADEESCISGEEWVPIYSFAHTT